MIAILRFAIMAAALSSAAAAAAQARFERFTYNGKSQETVKAGPGQYRTPSFREILP